MAADSVEPAADGLDRIRAKISTRQPVHSGWTTSAPAGFLGTLWRWLEPAVIWLRYLAGAVVERFRPDPGRAGRLGWLRPAAALATGVFVVAAASWVITALPAVITPANNSTVTSAAGQAAARQRRPIPVACGPPQARAWGPLVLARPSASRSCSSGPAKPRSTKSPGPSQSSSPSPSTSPLDQLVPEPVAVADRHGHRHADSERLSVNLGSDDQPGSQRRHRGGGLGAAHAVFLVGPADQLAA